MQKKMYISEKIIILFQGNTGDKCCVVIKAVLFKRTQRTYNYKQKELVKLSSKISLSFFITAIILTSIFGSVFYLKSKTSLKDRIMAHLNTTAQSRANHVKSFLEEDKVRIRIIAESGLIESTVEKIIRNTSDSNKFIAKANSILKDFMKAENEANELIILNPDGKIIASTNEKNIGTDRSADIVLLEGMKNTFIKDAH